MAPKKEVNTDEAPSGVVTDQSYTSADQDPVPVVKDDAGVEDPIHNTDDQDANSDAQLGEASPFIDTLVDHKLTG
jgi:hypothetical protein